MIVWLNGNFGAGKTSTATELSTLWPGAIVFDPEIIGVVLRMWTPPGAVIRDFQRIELWRELVATTCAGLVTEWGRPVIVPMTLLRPSYFEEIVGRLRLSGSEVHHFCLTAPVEVLRVRALDRARQQGEGEDLGWLEERWEEYDASNPLFAEHIDTTTGTAHDVAGFIAARLPHPLPASAGPARWREWSD